MRFRCGRCLERKISQPGEKVRASPEGDPVTLAELAQKTLPSFGTLLAFEPE